MAVRDDFTAGEVLAAADLNDTFASKLPYSYGTATPSTSDDGFLWYDSNSTPPDVKFWDGSAFQALGGGTVLQVVSATKTTSFTTTSTTFVDVTDVTVTLTPRSATNKVLVLVSGVAGNTGSNYSSRFNLVRDSTDIAQSTGSGSQDQTQQIFTASSSANTGLNMMFLDSPATTSATTYKLQAASTNASGTLVIGRSASNDSYRSITTITAIEVSA